MGVKTTLSGNPLAAGEALQVQVGIDGSQLEWRLGKRKLGIAFRASSR